MFEKIGKILWRTGILILFLTLILKNIQLQKVLTEKEVVTKGILRSIEHLSYDIISVSSIVMIIGLFLLIKGRVEPIDYQTVDLINGEGLRLRKARELKQIIKNNIPFTLVRGFMVILLLFGIVAVIIDKKGISSWTISVTMLLPITLVIRYYVIKLKNQFQALRDIDSELKK